MSGDNLTREEARARAELVLSAAYDVELDLTVGDTTFDSTTVARFGCRRPGEATWLDLIGADISEVTLNDRALDPSEVYDGTRLRLDDLREDNTVRVVSRLPYMRTGEGLHRFVDPVDDEVYLYSQFEVADARRVFACFDQPDLKARFGLTVTAPAHWQVVSNSPTPEPSPLPESAAGVPVARWAFEPTRSVSSYITALVAGPYHVVRDTWTSERTTGGDSPTEVALGVFCRASLAEYLDADEVLTVTKQGFAYFEETFDCPYPFAKYDQLFVPEFNAGAMENAGCVTIAEQYVFRSRVTDAAYEQRANTVLHELAHMWFGDLVTMRWWDDLWLNESFAEWASHEANVDATRYRNAWVTFSNLRKAWAYRQDQQPSTHPISADMVDLEAVEVNFDGITYAKGASALRQLVAWVGRDNFVAGLRTYFRRHAWGNTDLADLLRALEEVSGRDLGAWAAEWLQTSGVNTLAPEFSVGADGAYESVTIVQSASDQHPTLRSHRVAVGLYDHVGGALSRRDRIELDVTGERTPVPQLAGVRQPDLLLLNDGDLTFAKVHLDERSRATLVESIGSLDDPMARALCWQAATEMLRDAEIPTRDYVALVLGGIDTETDPGVLQTMLATTRAAIAVFAHPSNRMELSSLWAAGLHERLQTAEPGSDLQLAYARAWVSVVASPEHVGEVHDLLTGSASYEGLPIDTDLRWHLLKRLVSVGAAGQAEIDDELRRDETASGQREAIEARASLPTLEAKTAMWQEAVESDQLPNALQVHALLGLVQPDHRELLRPFTDRYFEILDEVWANRTNEMAQNIVVRCYPRLLVEPETVRKTDAWLAGDHPPALRRLVTEGKADVERALRAQERDLAG